MADIIYTPRESYGRLFFLDNTIESIAGDIDIQIGLTTSTANLVLNRNVVLATGKTFGLQDQQAPYSTSTLAVIGGVLTVGNANGIQAGQIKILNNIIESTSGGTDMQFGLSTSTANIVLNRNVVLATGKTFGLQDAVSPYSTSTLQVVSGVMILTGANGFQAGQIKIFDNTIESTNSSTQLVLGNVVAVANLLVNRNMLLNTGKTLTFGTGTNSTQTVAFNSFNAVTSITAGTGTQVSTSTGAVTVWNTVPAYTLPTASTSTLGGVKVDGTSITINSGVISATPATPDAFTSTSTTQASTLAVDMTTGPSMIFWQPGTAGNRAVTLSNFTAGRRVKIFITPKAGINVFTFTGVTASQCSNGVNTFVLGGGGVAQSSMMIEIFSTTTAIGGVWIFGYGSQ